MCTRQQCLELLSSAAPEIIKIFGVKKMMLFGSMARGDIHEQSDVDVFVEMPAKVFKVLALKDYLQNLLGIAVDLVRDNDNLDSFLINEINRDAIRIIS